ncbi:NAC transcription factor 47 like [Actinidia chinensis var. chinensis]|uniref:NAC transcription factor 47 like n=1 Tax=Actinidia chinensis var. chinensis TaxID=1590841 RepID=A0A2R6S222_ACTCC|nr:NAC transcription factor 47 like [Actinidia chinensis var. chinensis]
MAITFPVGFLFRPTDKEFIKHYLLKKQIGEELPLNGVIQKLDVYSEEVLSKSSDYVVCLLEKKERVIKQKNMQSKKNAGGALVNLTSGVDMWINKRMRLCEEKNQRIEQLLMKCTIEASTTTFPHGLIVMNVHENEVVMNTLAMPSPVYALPVTVIESAPIAQQVTPIYGESGFESMVNAENVVATDTLATLQPSASYNLSES